MKGLDDWMPIVNFPGYFVSKNGSVRGITRKVKQRGRSITVKGKVLAIQYDKKGYARVQLRKNSKAYTIRIHLLVWDTFGKGDRTSFCVDHKNRIKKDNRLSNLRLLTNRENAHNRNKEKTTSKYVGVSKTKCGRWLAQIYDKKHINLGRYDTEEEAYIIFNKRLEKINGRDR